MSLTATRTDRFERLFSELDAHGFRLDAAEREAVAIVVQGTAHDDQRLFLFVQAPRAHPELYLLPRGRGWTEYVAAGWGAFDAVEAVTQHQSLLPYPGSSRSLMAGVTLFGVKAAILCFGPGDIQRVIVLASEAILDAA